MHRKARKESTSFLKKRSKKLSPNWSSASTANDSLVLEVFWFFFSKKNTLPSGASHWNGSKKSVY
jgi:hypothetical protein